MSCDGKKCGQGKHIGAGRYLCPHSSLKALHPTLCEEWDPENTRTSDQYLPGSNAKVKWICKDNPCGCHKWEATIYNRVGNGSSCPYCVNQKICPHNSLKVLYPKLCEEWSPENKNTADYYSPGSGIKVKWICQNNSCGCHKWESTICNRVYNDTGCPYCNINKVCPHNNLQVLHPELCEEWDPENTNTPDKYSSGCHVKVKWICKLNPCGCHNYEATIAHRVYSSSGCPYCVNQKLCVHNNLKALYPRLCEEWAPENVSTPEEHSSGSGSKIKWICANNLCGCHKWEATIAHRVSGRGCPYCNSKKICPHNNFKVLYPELCEEWDAENTHTPDKYLPGSHAKVRWICKYNPCGCHRWQTTINARTSGNGCPYCTNQKICSHNNLQVLYPELCKEWDPENISTSDQYSSGSNAMVKWICKYNLCGCHKWEATIYARVVGSGCPYCVNQKICSHNNLKVLYPRLCEEWDPENTSTPDQYSSGSGMTVKWICKYNLCGCHKWEAIINDRVGGYRIGTNCPYCNNKKTCSHNNLKVLYPKLCEEWDPENINTPEQYLPGSDAKVRWICKNNPYGSHKWEATISHRAGGNRGCPHCAASRGYSEKQLKWIDKISEKYNIEIRSAQSPNGEFRVQLKDKSYKLDGFACINNKNIAFEFDGCFWHGCKTCYESTDINTVTGKSFGELCLRTQLKHQRLIEAGFILIIMKECEFDEDNCCNYDDKLF